ncbi:MAG TPA: hypothetical protein VHL11_00505 [Phototrophicaceae bacterium]|jgi:hypothetical protein|nr:hypothetical protein [Phototrophicaceae bacterium]
MSNLTLPLLDMTERPARQTMGRLGELYAAYLFRKSGYIPIRQRQTDLIVINPATGESLRVEVKTARRPDGKYVFQIWNHTTDYRHSDRLLLLAVQKSGYPVVFVTPTDAFTFRSTIVITSHTLRYQGRWAVYRQSSDLITFECPLERLTLERVLSEDQH